MKWSDQEDDILRGFVQTRAAVWDEIALFLPSRSPCSIEARWKRIMYKQAEGFPDVDFVVNAKYIPEEAIPVCLEDFGPYEQRKMVISKIWDEYKSKPKKQSETLTNYD